MQTTATTLHRTFEDPDLRSLVLHNECGDVEVHLDAMPGTASLELVADRELDFEPTDIGVRDGQLTVDIPGLLSSEGKSGFSFSLGPLKFSGGDTATVDVTVHLPSGSEVTVKTKSGDIDVYGEGGATSVTTGSGDVDVETATQIKAASGSGDITVRMCSHGTATTGSGDIEVSAIGPGNLQLRSGSGDIDATSKADETTAATGSGDIDLDLRRGTAKLRTGTGDVEVTVPQDIPVWLDLTTPLGEISRNIDSVGAPAEGQDYLSVSVRSGTGDITVTH